MYLRSIDILRGVSVLLVLLHHFNIPYKLQDTWLGVHIFGESLSTLLARNGNYGVTMFFVISGFLITQHSLARYTQLSQLKLRDFYIRRIARIMPCLVLLVGLVTVLGLFNLPPFVNHAPNGQAVSYPLTLFAAFSFWMNLLIIQYGWVNYALGVLWSLSVEEVFYLFFPLLCLVLRHKTALVMFLLAVIAYAPYFRTLKFLDSNEAYLYHYFSSFDAIAIGCLAALLWQKLNSAILAQRWLQYTVMTAMVTLYLYAPIKLVAPWSMSVFASLTAILILSFKHQPEKMSQTLLSKWQHLWIWLGKRSYELYLFHLMVLGLMKVVFVPAQTSALAKLILLPVFLILACLLAAVIEKYYSTPLNKNIRKWFLSGH
ncbi:acyltransferase [Acinetobacter sp. MD2(2019)]|uniref:acyltransferase family protein n=1 Tax=Acinetobacter sp. MD2(2019) TaxID=2605273 RepID=UPI002D1F40F8|nr:acyltransferase [Acinetobacter sp. MD2(2019)]MEB3753438.1 acyltransferase [Acinetobacter sp. MD2(2019)]